MSSVPRVSPSIESSRHPSAIITNNGAPSAGLFPDPISRILMVGRSTSWGAPLQLALQKLGCNFSFAPSLRVTAEYVRKGAYALLLLDSTVPPELRRRLVSSLTGSRTSIYQLFPVENGCWWLPALLFGEDCFGAPGFRTKDIPAELERILRYGQ